MEERIKAHVVAWADGTWILRDEHCVDSYIREQGLSTDYAELAITVPQACEDLYGLIDSVVHCHFEIP